MAQDAYTLDKNHNVVGANVIDPITDTITKIADRRTEIIVRTEAIDNEISRLEEERRTLLAEERELEITVNTLRKFGKG